MKKMVLLFSLLVIAAMAFAQGRELSETVVEPPKFVGNNEVVNIDNGKSLICNYLQNSLGEESVMQEGVVVVLFTVTHNGEVDGFSIVNSVSGNADRAVIESLKETSGMWKPGLVNGVARDMEKEIFVGFNFEDGLSLRDQAKSNIILAVKKYQSAVHVGQKLHLSNETAERRTQRKLRAAMVLLEDANKYQPFEPSVAFWQGHVHNLAGNELKSVEKFNEFNELIDPYYMARIESVDIVLR